ncbi:MAG: hypothetical protein QOG31_1081 [Thermoplasmata archaeon]|jgi:hypothetical protein|nr:hypothetical protein [Thermoplasmata archaeon]
MELTDCVGQFTDFTFPGDTNPGQHPPGWNRETERPTSGIIMESWKCQRVSWGPFERGPVSMLFESHTNGFSPPKCQIKATGTEAILTSWWISDADLAAYAQTMYHAPALFGTFDFTASNVGPIIQHKISWGLPGKPASSFDVVEGQDYRPADPSPLLRVFWFDNSTVHLMDQYAINSLPNSPGDLVTGKMYPPMLMAKTTENYVSEGEWYRDSRLSADFASFKDLQCNEPGL